MKVKRRGFCTEREGGLESSGKGGDTAGVRRAFAQFRGGARRQGKKGRDGKTNGLGRGQA